LNPVTTNAKRGFVYGTLLLGIGLAGMYYLWGPLFSKPLGEPRRIGFANKELSPEEQLQFLGGNFRIIKNLRELPGPVLDALMEEGGTRLTMVNPGKRFEASDVIVDPSLPNRRLIFAGVEDNKVFIHYEQGGIAHMFILALLRLSPEGKIEGLSRDFCGPEADLQTLRSEIEHGNCTQAVPPEMR